jgi:hypothetical protein
MKQPGAYGKGHVYCGQTNSINFISLSADGFIHQSNFNTTGSHIMTQS